MQKYIDQLVTDLHHIGVNIQDRKVSSMLVDTDSYLVTNNPVSRMVNLSRITGISKYELPEKPNITEEHAGKLVSGILKVLLMLKIIPDFPVNIPETVKYNLLRDYWETEFVIANKEHHIDFCHFHPGNCPYIQFCSICNDLDD